MIILKGGNIIRKLKLYSRFIFHSKKNLYICMFALIFVYLSFSIYVSIYEEAIGQIQKSNYSEVISDILAPHLILVTCANIFFIIYLFLNYFREKVRNYDILQMIGGSRKTIVRFVLVEYLSMMIITIFLATIINVLTMIVLKTILKTNIENLFPPIYIIILYLFVVSISICATLCLMIRRKHIPQNSKLLQWIEKRTNVIRKVIRSSFVCLGIACCGWSIYILINYSVPNMLLSIFIAMIGIFLVTTFISPLILEKVRRHDKIYLKNLIAINNFRDRLKSNNLILRILILLNFVVIFLVGATIAPHLSQDHREMNNIRFPYEEVIITKGGNIDEGINLLAVEDLPRVLLINLIDYNQITGSNDMLSDNEVIYTVQRVDDDLPGYPYGEDTVDLFLEGKNERFNLIRQEYRIVFGEFLSSELLELLVVTPDTFQKIKESQHSESFTMILSQEKQLSEEMRLPQGSTTIFNKDSLISKLQVEDTFILFTVISLGIGVLIMCWFMIYIKIKTEFNKTLERYRFLEILGMQDSEIIKLSVNEINLAVLPGVLIGSVWGVIDFFIMFSNMSDGSEMLLGFLVYIVYILIVSIIQLIFYICLRRYFSRVYKGKLFNVDRREVVDFEGI